MLAQLVMENVAIFINEKGQSVMPNYFHIAKAFIGARIVNVDNKQISKNNNLFILMIHTNIANE
jgi:hypothetical protein